LLIPIAYFALDSVFKKTDIEKWCLINLYFGL
jgi:hypothetical protein